MPSLAFAPAVPHNPRNYMIPSRICAFWQSACPDGTLDDPISLGSISNIELTPTETTIELKSAYKGIQSIDQRVIVDISGTLSFQIHEMVGSNLNLLFRSVTVTARTNANGNPVTVFGETTLNLGDAAVEIDPNAIDVDPTTGSVTKPDLNVLRVQGTQIVDPVTGRGTQYAINTDYTIAAAATGTSQSLTFSGASGAAPAASATATGSAWIDYVSGGGDADAPVAAENISSALRIAYTGGTGTAPQVGEIINDGTNDFAVLFVEAGATGVAGTVHAINTTGATFVVANAAAASTGDRGFVATLALGVTDADAIDNVGTVAVSAGTLFFSAALVTANAAFQVGAPVLIQTGTGYTAGECIIATVSALETAQPTGTIDSVDISNTNFAGGLGAGIVGLTGTAGAFKVGDPNVTIGAATDAVLSAVTASSGADADTGTGTTISRVSAGSITSGQEVNVTFTYARDGNTYSMLDGVVIEGQLQLQVLALNGPQSMYTFFRVNLQIEGSISLNPEERTQPTLQATILPRLSDGRRAEFTLFSGFTGFSLSSC